MKTLNDIHSGKGRGPFSVGAPMRSVIGVRETKILLARDCETFPHRLNRDCDFYLSDDCITYFSPSEGAFAYRVSNNTLVG